MNECKPLALGTPSPWVVDWVAAPPRTAPSPRRRALPSGPILGIYASWDNHKQCAERTTRSVLQGVNVIFWFGMGMHVNDTTVGLEATRRLMTCRAAFQWTRSSSSSTRHSCMARYRLFVCSYATRTPDPARWACHSSHRACTRSASSRSSPTSPPLVSKASRTWLRTAAGTRRNGRARVGPGGHCTPRHRMPFNSSNEGSRSVSMTWRACPWQIFLATSQDAIQLTRNKGYKFVSMMRRALSAWPSAWGTAASSGSRRGRRGTPAWWPSWRAP